MPKPKNPKPENPKPESARAKYVGPLKIEKFVPPKRSSRKRAK